MIWVESIKRMIDMENNYFIESGINDNILKALERLGYNEPTEVQERVIPNILNHKDIIVKSKTGSGKTAAFAIPLCEMIEIDKRKPQVLILTPTRELALQVKEEFASIGIYKRIRCSAVFGKQPMEIQLRELKQGVHAIVGTPGRTFDHINRESISLEDIKYLVIDEADEMLNMGFIDQVEDIVSRLSQDRVTILLSATVPERIELLCSKYMKQPEKIEINPHTLAAEEVNQIYFLTKNDEKFDLLSKIIYSEQMENAIIFCNTKDSVDRIVKNMIKKGFSCRGLHGGMEQKDRIETIKAFKMGDFDFLAATDVAARGIHIDNLSFVINYEIPREKESYVHRIGRTGRAGNQGKAITLIEHFEEKILISIESYIGHEIPRGELPSEELIRKGKEAKEHRKRNKQKSAMEKENKLNNDITKIYINGGKKKKIRAGDIVGAITGIEGVDAANIGIIDIQDNLSYVDILDGKGEMVIQRLQDSTIKGKKVRVEKAGK